MFGIRLLVIRYGEQLSHYSDLEFLRYDMELNTQNRWDGIKSK